MKLEVTANLVPSQGRALEMARGADHDFRQGIHAIASSAEAIQPSFPPALVRGNQREDCADAYLPPA